MPVPFPGSEEYVCYLLSCSSQKIKKSVCGMLTKILLVWIGILPLCAYLESGFYLFLSGF